MRGRSLRYLKLNGYIMKRKKYKPTIKEVSQDVGTLFRVISQMGSTMESVRILLENYLEMKEETGKLADYIEAKTKDMINVNQKSEEDKEGTDSE